MTKDYASRQKAKLHARARGVYARSAAIQPANSSLPSWVWMCAGIMLGLLLTAGIYWRYHPLAQPLASTPNLIEEKLAHPDTTTALKKNSPPSAADKGPARFDFYTVLPAMTMEIPSYEAGTTNRAAVNAAGKTQPEAASEQAIPGGKEKAAPALTYIIQMGSYRQLAQAEELKAKLAFSGLEASIQTIKLDNGESRYRVYIGPFSSKEAALASQQQIHKAHQLNGLLVRIHV